MIIYRSKKALCVKFKHCVLIYLSKKHCVLKALELNRYSQARVTWDSTVRKQLQEERVLGRRNHANAVLCLQGRQSFLHPTL